jgi:hypothetical protein
VPAIFEDIPKTETTLDKTAGKYYNISGFEGDPSNSIVS